MFLRVQLEKKYTFSLLNDWKLQKNAPVDNTLESFKVILLYLNLNYCT